MDARLSYLKNEGVATLNADLLNPLRQGMNVY